MPNKNSQKAIYWFSKADDDLKFAKAGFRETKIPSDACFLSQQVAEKYLKGFLINQGKNFKRTHNLLKLLNSCAKIDKSFKKLFEDCKGLNIYYIEARYPDDILINYTINEAKNALRYAENIINFIQEKVKSKQ